MVKHTTKPRRNGPKSFEKNEEELPEDISLEKFNRPSRREMEVLKAMEQLKERQENPSNPAGTRVPRQQRRTQGTTRSGE